LNDHVGNVVVLLAYLNGLLNPLIYVLKYNVVKRSLANWITKTAARMKNSGSAASQSTGMHPL